MSSQLPLLAAWAVNFSALNPQDRLEQLRIDRLEARARMQEALDWLVDRHRANVLLPPGAIKKATEDAMGYCDEALAEATGRIEGELEREIEEEIDRLERRGLW
jgi:hypothetical protein